MISITTYIFEGKIIEHLKRNKGKYALGAAGLLGAAVAAKLGHDDDTPVKKMGKAFKQGTDTEPNNVPVKKIGTSLKRKVEDNPEIAAAKKLKAELKRKANDEAMAARNAKLALKRKAESDADHDAYLRRREKTPYNRIIDKAARRHKVDPEFVRGVIGAESGFDHKRVSKAGAVGLMQIMPETAKQLKIDPHDPVQNIHGGTKHLAYLLKKYDGNKEAAAAAYNAGEGRYDRHGQDLERMPRETKKYVPKVMRNYIGKDYGS